MKLIKQKKRATLLFPPLVWGIIALIVLVIIIVGWSGGFGKLFQQLMGFGDNSGDCDQDGANNIFDDCPTWPGDSESGCPDQSVIDSQMGGDKKKCYSLTKEECKCTP